MAGDIARGLRAMLAANLLRVVSKGLVILVLARWLLTPETYGLLFLAVAILGTVKLLSNFGLPKSTARFVTEHVETAPGQVPHLLRFSFTVNLVTITVVGAGLFLSKSAIAALLGEPALEPLLGVGVLYVVGRSLQSHIGLLFQAFNDVRWTALLRSTFSIGQFVLAPALVLLGFGVVGALWGFILASLVSASIGLAVLYVHFYRTYEPDETMTPGLGRRVLRYSIPLTATKGANLLDKRVDTMLVAYFMNPVAVGYYTLAKQISMFVGAPAQSLGFTVSPQYGTHKANDELDQAASLYRQAYVGVVTLYVPAAVGMILVAEPGVRYVFGSDYLGAVPAVQVFALYTLLQALAEITNDGLDYLGQADLRAKAKTATSVANFGLNLVMIPAYGVVGAAVATIMTLSALVAVEIYVIWKELPLSATALAVDVAKAAGIASIMGGPVLILLPYVTGVFTLVGVIGTGIAVWAVLVTASGTFDVRQVTSVLGS